MKGSDSGIKLRILLVEDHPDTRHILSHLLRHFGYYVDSAESYQLALQLLAISQFHVLLSDIALPDGDGCNLVRAAKQTQALVSIALSAYSSRQDIERGMEAGFDYYLSKPLDVRELRTILNQIVT